MAQVPGGFSISKMLRKETHDLLMVQGIEFFGRVWVNIHQSVHLFHSSLVIYVSPRCISTPHAGSNHSYGLLGLFDLQKRGGLHCSFTTDSTNLVLSNYTSTLT